MNETSRNQGRAIAAAAAAAALLFVIGILNGSYLALAIPVAIVTLFALGLVLIRAFADDVVIDPHVVIYGSIELSYLDQTSLLGWSVPRGAVVNGGALLINGLLFLLFHKELKLTAFDESLAASMGFRPQLVQGVLMAMTAAMSASVRLMSASRAAAAVSLANATALAYSRAASRSSLLEIGSSNMGGS